MKIVRESKRRTAGRAWNIVRRLRAQRYRVNTTARPEADSSPGARPAPSRTFTYTYGGRKLHLLREDGSTACGFDGAQMALVESPLPLASICEWCQSTMKEEDDADRSAGAARVPR